MNQFCMRSEFVFPAKFLSAVSMRALVLARGYMSRFDVPDQDCLFGETISIRAALPAAFVGLMIVSLEKGNCYFCVSRYLELQTYPGLS